MFEQVTEGAGPLNCRIRSGEVVGFVGLRGAGQECVGRVLFGLAPATGGRMLLDGRTIARVSAPGDGSRDQSRVCRSRRGISRSLAFDPRKPVPQSGRGRPHAGLVTPDRESRAAFELGERIGLKPNDCSLPIEWLSGGNQQKVVVGRWLHLEASVYALKIRPRVSTLARKQKSIGCSIS